MLLEKVQDILLVSFGALLGVNIRYIIYSKLQIKNVRKEYIFLLVNTFASFSLGFFLSLFSQITFLNSSYELALFFLVGFLGSLSTFSTFIYDLFDLFLQFKFLSAIKLFVLSSSLGIISFAVGIALND